MANWVELVEIKRDTDIEYYAETAVKLVKYHKEYADKLGVYDQVVCGYTKDRALRHLGKPGYNHYNIKKCGINIGILEVEKKVSGLNGEPALYIDKVYIEKIARETGVFSIILDILKQKNPDIKTIELECWYSLPATEVYNHLGFKPIVTRYVKEENGK